MSRMDEIRERFEYRGQLPGNWSDDIPWLLDRLERAKNAIIDLRVIADIEDEQDEFVSDLLKEIEG